MKSLQGTKTAFHGEYLRGLKFDELGRRNELQSNCQPVWNLVIDDTIHGVEEFSYVE
jgi:hypothetical protein